MGSQRWVVEVAGEQHKIRVLHDFYPGLFRRRAEMTVWVDGEIIYEITTKNYMLLVDVYPIKVGNTELVIRVQPPRFPSSTYRVSLEKDGKRL